MLKSCEFECVHTFFLRFSQILLTVHSKQVYALEVCTLQCKSIHCKKRIREFSSRENFQSLPLNVWIAPRRRAATRKRNSAVEIVNKRARLAAESSCIVIAL